MAVARRHFEPVAAFAPDYADALVTGDEATRVLQTAECSPAPHEDDKN